MGMILTDEQQAILDGARGETMAKVMKTLVMFGEAFHAEKMVPVTSRYNHLVTSFGLGVLQPVYDLMQQLIDAGAVSGQKFSADPRPLDPNVPANLLQQLVFKKFMYNKQDFYEGQLEKLGLLNKDAFTCTCYMSEVGNKPEQGDADAVQKAERTAQHAAVLIFAVHDGGKEDLPHPAEERVGEEEKNNLIEVHRGLSCM